MIHLFTGTDRAKAREALERAASKSAAPALRITDSHQLEDLAAALSGGGMFAQARVVIFDGILANQSMRDLLFSSLASLSSATEPFYIYEEKPDAATRKQLEKHTQTSVTFDLAKGRAAGGNVFALADAMNRGDKKNLWIGYQSELAQGAAPEAIHGVLFWGAKKALLAARSDAARQRPARLVAELAALPHEARREGEDLEYALERFVLGVS